MDVVVDVEVGVEAQNTEVGAAEVEAAAGTIHSRNGQRKKTFSI